MYPVVQQLSDVLNRGLYGQEDCRCGESLLLQLNLWSAAGGILDPSDPLSDLQTDLALWVDEARSNCRKLCSRGVWFCITVLETEGVDMKHEPDRKPGPGAGLRSWVRAMVQWLGCTWALGNDFRAAVSEENAERMVLEAGVETTAMDWGPEQ